MKPHLITEIEDGIKAGKTGFILQWNTNDRQHFIQEGIYPMSLHVFLAAYFGRKGYHCGLYSQGVGMQQLNPPGSSATGNNPFSAGAGQTLGLLTPVLRRTDSKVCLIVQYSDLLAPLAEGSVFLQPEQQVLLETLHRWGADDGIRQAQNLVILISYENGVNSLLTRSGVYKTINVQLPGLESRQEFITMMLAANTGKSSKYASLEPGFTPEELSRVSNGLRLTDIEALFRSQTGGVIKRSDIQSVKGNTIKEMAGGLVEVVEPTEGFEAIAGLPTAKEFFMDLKWMFQHGSTDVPYAMILAGVPGTGKSRLCHTLAKELNMPLLIVRNLFGQYVGQSEQNLERVLQVVNSMSPCLVLMEEMDQSIGQRGTGASGDSGTSNRMSQRLWEALGSNTNRGKNLWIGTSNRPDLLDDAMLDRFQIIIPFLHPTPDEVAELLITLAKQQHRALEPNVDTTEISRLPNLALPTVRCLTEIVTTAGQRADIQARQTNTPISQQHLLAAARDTKLTYDVVKHELIALKTIAMVPKTSLMPWMSKNGIRPNAQIPSYLQSIVDRETGLIDANRLHERIRALEIVVLGQQPIA